MIDEKEMPTQPTIPEKRQRGRPPKLNNPLYPHRIPIIDFSGGIEKLNTLDIDPRMMETMVSGLPLDELVSYEGGVPCATNIMCVGDAGVGKTTILLDLLASVQNKSDRRCLFICGEMGRKQMFKYTQRFPQFGIVQTMFVSDYLSHNTKDVIEQVLDIGWDLILVDSIAEVLDGVRDDNDWDRKRAESWLVETFTKNNKGENKENLYTTFLLIQQVTKGGDFVGSNRLKHMTDALLEMRIETGRGSTGNTYLEFTKNRNGPANIKFSFQLLNNAIYYGTMVKTDQEFEVPATEAAKAAAEIIIPQVLSNPINTN